VITFEKAGALREAAVAVPLDRMLVETDSPFLAPVPFRGQTNEPRLVAFTVAAICELRSEDAVDIAQATIDNARRLFKDRLPTSG
jgi:TatD DNase family protein